MKDVLRQGKLEPKDIHDVVLVGPRVCLPPPPAVDEKLGGAGIGGKQRNGTWPGRNHSTLPCEKPLGMGMRAHPPLLLRGKRGCGAVQRKRQQAEGWAGGSTRIPKVQQLLKEFFKGKEPNRGLPAALGVWWFGVWWFAVWWFGGLVFGGMVFGIWCLVFWCWWC